MPDLDRILTGHARPRPPETPSQARRALDSDSRSSWRCTHPGCKSPSLRWSDDKGVFLHIGSYSVPVGLDHKPEPVRPPRFQPLSEVEEDAHQAELRENFAAPCPGCGGPHAYYRCPDDPFIDIEIEGRMEERA